MGTTRLTCGQPPDHPAYPQVTPKREDLPLFSDLAESTRAGLFTHTGGSRAGIFLVCHPADHRLA